MRQRLLSGVGPVVLGLVTIRSSRIEPLGQLQAGPCGANALVDAERLALSPRCGICRLGGRQHHYLQAQRAKLALLIRAARDFLPASAAI